MLEPSLLDGRGIELTIAAEVLAHTDSTSTQDVAPRTETLSPDLEGFQWQIPSHEAPSRVLDVQADFTPTSA